MTKTGAIGRDEVATLRPGKGRLPASARGALADTCRQILELFASE